MERRTAKTTRRSSARKRAGRITVVWLDGACQAREWPPSPWRLYQAMRAGVGARVTPALEAAMRHLETLPPPRITAPRAHAESPVTVSGPNNDADAVLTDFNQSAPAMR